MSIAENPILTQEQKHFLSDFRGSPIVQKLYLTGGTTLSAFYLQHRVSEDLDLFTSENIPIEDVLAFTKTLQTVEDVQYERKYDRKIFLLKYPVGRLLKVEFTLYPFPRIEKGKVVEGVEIDSLRDILVNKLMAMTDRRDAKDYVDLYFALQSNENLDLEQLMLDAEIKFGIHGVEDILKGRFLEGLPPTGTLVMRSSLDHKTVDDFFTETARQWIAGSLEGEADEPDPD